MASKLITRIQKLEEATTPQESRKYILWWKDGDTHTRRTDTGNVIKLCDAEWQQYIKGEKVITLKWPEELL